MGFDVLVSFLFRSFFFFFAFPCGSAGREAVCNVGDLGSIPGLGRSPGKGKGYPLQYSGLENSMDTTEQLHFTSKCHINRMKENYHTIISIDSETAPDKTHTLP